MDEFYPLRHHAKGGFKTSYFLPNDHEHLLLTVFSGLVSLSPMSVPYSMVSFTWLICELL